ncbi:hypothetical protein FPSE_11452 [Fusarium pseudograminearum CS3096]|uniref:Uncharacterized protein n=1 Tax=Fusarium pseudograminearum (strain CS3096) TaxID=1028729 RepID=K3V612_FUSPC|nr:hypothetical protein FPSE_11452 [Fusarium pseudograminearum CS3096]EKJ68444.1 hypothetical protein FPSE_11452 [Fusarium pseudograminearum CS3096]
MSQCAQDMPFLPATVLGGSMDEESICPWTAMAYNSEYDYAVTCSSHNSHRSDLSGGSSASDTRFKEVKESKPASDACSGFPQSAVRRWFCPAGGRAGTSGRSAPVPPGQHKLSALFESKTTATSGAPANKRRIANKRRASESPTAEPPSVPRASTESPSGPTIDSDSLPRFDDCFQTYSVCITVKLGNWYQVTI